LPSALRFGFDDTQKLEDDNESAKQAHPPALRRNLPRLRDRGVLGSSDCRNTGRPGAAHIGRRIERHPHRQDGGGVR
jgi:hypothetical protein